MIGPKTYGYMPEIPPLAGRSAGKTFGKILELILECILEREFPKESSETIRHTSNTILSSTEWRV